MLFTIHWGNDFQALLNRNPMRRLGANGGQEVKNHPFFACIDWQLLYDRRIPPPFNPCRHHGDDADTVNFEKEFTNMALMSVDENSSNAKYSVEEEGHFLNFTYEEESNLEKLRDTFIATRRANK